MPLDPFERFLGVHRGDSPESLLGLPGDDFDQVMIESCLRERLLQTYDHPDGRSEDADDVRQVLRAAADQLKAEIKRRSLRAAISGSSAASSQPSTTQSARRRGEGASASALKLTQFDRMVMAVLVGCGGWNAQSRSRLVSLAAAYDISVQGLIRVIRGLSDYARTGGPRLGVKEIAGGGLTVQRGSAAGGAPIAPALLDRMVEDLAAELKRDSPWPTIKLAVVFGLVTIAACVVALRIVLSGEPRPQPISTSGADGTSARTTHATTRRPTTPSSIAANKPRIAVFPQTPTFLGNGLPPEAVGAVDECARLPADLDELGRKLAVADKPSDAVYRQWDWSIQMIATGWVLADVSTRNEIDTALSEALRNAADTPSVCDRLLKTLTPPATFTDPIDLWRGAWLAGTLGAISSSQKLPPVAVERARAQLEVALNVKSSSDMNFESAAREWLQRQTPALVAANEIKENAYDLWELWITAHRALGSGGGRGDRFDAACLDAIEHILATETDLARPGPSVNILARLLNMVIEHPSETVKQRIAGWFDATAITSRDLWVLTSLLSMSDQARWFPDDLVLPEDADQRHRWRVRDELISVWPAQDSKSSASAELPAAIKADAAQVARWNAILGAVIRQPSPRNQDEHVMRLIQASRLNEAAEAITLNDADLADSVMSELERTVTGELQTRGKAGGPPSPAPPAGAPPPQPRTVVSPNGRLTAARPGQAIGADSDWTTAYKQLGRNIEQRVESLRRLRATAGTDLGSIDAETLVSEAYRGSPQEVRTAAQDVLAQRFANGPIVALELLDQLPNAPQADGTSQLIQNVTGTTLGDVRDQTWPIEVRAALVKHNLRLRSDDAFNIDATIEVLTESYAKRAAALKHEKIIASVPESAQDAARILAEAWSDRAALAMPASAMSEDLASIRRRAATRLCLAEGPIQRFVAHQLNILDLLTYVTIAEQPALHEQAMTLLRTWSGERARAAGVMGQAVAVELNIAQIWKLRLGSGVETESATTEPDA